MVYLNLQVNDREWCVLVILIHTVKRKEKMSRFRTFHLIPSSVPLVQVKGKRQAASDTGQLHEKYKTERSNCLIIT